MSFIPDDFPPLFRIVIALRHHDADLFSPPWSQLQNLLVDLHGNGARISHDHSLSGQDAGTVILIVIYNVVDQGVDGLLST